MRRGGGLDDIDFIAFYEKPILKFDRIFETSLAFAPRGFTNFASSMPLWVKEKLFQRKLILKELSIFGSSTRKLAKKLLFSEHHLSHAASAYFPSPFDEAAILTIDAVGEWTTTSLSLGKKNKLETISEIKFPHSIGLLYSAFTSYLGFRVNSGEYKVMGLAPYGAPRFVDIIENSLIDFKEDGSFRLNMKYFDFATGLNMTNRHFQKLFGVPPRNPEEELREFDMDLAASIQVVLDKAILRLTSSVARLTGARNLCLAGGVALNCVANGKVLRDGKFERIWIQPAAGDAGGALGAALSVYHIMLGYSRDTFNNTDSMSGAFLGPEYSDLEVREQLKKCNANFERIESADLFRKTAMALSNGKAVGWMQDRMEFGPRALGNRSILADPRSSTMQRDLNLKIKFRESFRPFAPSVLRSHVQDWFDMNEDSPYMLLVADVLKEKRVYSSPNNESDSPFAEINELRSQIPAVTHIDYSARIHTVSTNVSPKFSTLLKEFYAITGVPLLVNTSFNVRGEPIVCSPEDAYRCFMGTGLDVLVVGNYYLEKEMQDSKLLQSDYKNSYLLD
jgi:carbamoyltransferase